MKHPFEHIQSGDRRRIFPTLLIATIIIFIIWVSTVNPMSDEKAPLSATSFGMAGSVSLTQETVASWDEPRA